jgi:hypothetical protein
MKAEKEVAVEDETMGGQQDNIMLGLHKQVRQRERERER